MVDTDYELLPERDILKLKKELNELKVISSQISPEKLDELNNNIKELINIIKAASDQMRFEETDIYSKKLDTIIDQNERIAEGIIAIADMIKKPKLHEPTAPEHLPSPKPQPPKPVLRTPVPPGQFPPPPVAKSFPQPQMSSSIPRYPYKKRFKLF